MVDTPLDVWRNRIRDGDSAAAEAVRLNVRLVVLGHLVARKPMRLDVGLVRALVVVGPLVALMMAMRLDVRLVRALVIGPLVALMMTMSLDVGLVVVGALMPVEILRLHVFLRSRVPPLSTT